MTTPRPKYAPPQPASSAWRIVIGYTLVVLVVIGLLWLVLSYGSERVSPRIAVKARRNTSLFTNSAISITCCWLWCRSCF